MIAAVVLQGLTLLLAWTMVRRLAPPASAALVGAATYLLAAHTAVLGAGLAGRLDARVVALVLLGMLAASAWLARRPSNPRVVARERGASVGETIVAAVSLGTLVLWLWPHVHGATRLWIWDDYTYHLVYPVLWLRAHAIAAVSPEQAFTMQAWYPLSASVVSAWFMLPFSIARGEALAWVSLTAVLYAMLVIGGMVEILRRAGAPPGAWALSLVLFATSTRTEVMASSFSDADLAQAAALFAALAFAMPRAGTEESDGIRLDAGFAALLTGFAIGVKVSALPAACVVLVMICMRVGRRAAALFQVVAGFAGAWAVTGGYWYARNWAATGNPLYPAEFLMWPGATFPHTTLREYAAHWGLARVVGDALTVYLNWPMFHAFAALTGLGALAIRLAAGRTRQGAERSFAGGGLAITAVTLLALPTMPFSAGNGMTFVSGIVHWDSMRYVALLPLLGWTALALVIGTGARNWRTSTSSVLMIAAAWAAAVPLTSWAAATAGGGTLALTWRRVRGVAPRAGVAVALAGALAWFASFHAAKVRATGESIHREPLFGKAAAIIDEQPAGTRIAVYGDQWVYPTFGDRHRLVPVRLDGDGRIATMPIGDAMTPGPLTVDVAAFRANLRASGIGLVAVVHLPHPGRSPDWPSQAATLDRMEGVRSIYRDGAVGLWRVEGP